MHPGAVCLATIPPVQNHSPLQRWKHPFACHLPQEPFDREFSPPRRAQFLPMIPPLPLNLSRTLPYPPLFLPYPAEVFLPPSLWPTTLPLLPIRRTFSVFAGRSLYSPDVLLLLLFSPSTLHTLLVRRKLYHPPKVVTVRRTLYRPRNVFSVRRTLYSPPSIFPYLLSHCLPDRLVFIHATNYYHFLAYNRPPATQPLHY